jgi:undecaprenyl diphosphate synthase
MQSQINKEKLPKHIAIIMDGNGRWAKNQGQERIFGHHSGVEAVRDTVEAAAEIGIEYLTLYAFSTENWNRPKSEINALMSLLVSTIKSELPTLQKNNIRLQTIGDTESLPDATRKELLEAIEATQQNTRMCLVLALSYSARWELVQAVRAISEQVQAGKLSPSEIDEQVLTQFLSTRNIPDPELLIRTSGETRVSNFLLWQIAYSEFYFTSVFWPDFRRKDLYAAIYDYQNRERRFGMISEQI